MNGHPLRCGCIIHTESEDVVGCPVFQVERLNALASELEKLLEASRLAAFKAGQALLDSLPEGFEEDDAA